MQIKVVKLEEAGYNPAMFGLSLNKNQPVEKMPEVALRLSTKDKGHNKFLEHIIIWLEIRAPRYWWADADTYRLSSKQSQSTNHTIMKKPLEIYDFEDNDITIEYLAELNKLIEEKDFLRLKKKLPEGFMQTREWCMSYKTLANIIVQRYHHKLPQWKRFIYETINQINYPELLITRIQ